MKIEILPLDVIELPEWAHDIRLRLEDTIRELKRSIMAYGFTTPIYVVKREDSYVVVDGVTRVIVAQELGIRDVPAIIDTVSKGVSDVALFHRALDLNLAQAGMGPVSRLKAVAYLVRKGWTIEAACERVGVSEQWFRKYRPILELPEEVQAQVEKGELSLSEALSRKGGQTATYPLPSSGYSATSHPSGRRSSKRSLECYLCGKPIKAHERTWRPFHRSCLEVLDSIMRNAVEVERSGRVIKARCRRCGEIVFWAEWTGTRWVVSTELPVEEREDPTRPTPPGERKPGAREAGEEA